MLSSENIKISELESKRAIILVTGKSSPNLYQLVKRVSTYWDLALVEPNKVIQDIIQKEGGGSGQNEAYQQVRDLLLTGQSIGNELLSRCFYEYLSSPTVLFRGAVVYGFFDLCQSASDLGAYTDSWSKLQKLWQQENLQSSSVHINYSDGAIMLSRHPNYLFDPMTQSYYSREDFDFSARVHAAKKAEEDDDDASSEASDNRPPNENGVAAADKDAFTADNPPNFQRDFDDAIDKGEVEEGDEENGGNAGNENEANEDEQERRKSSFEENEGEGEEGEDDGANNPDETEEERDIRKQEAAQRRKAQEEKKRLIPADVMNRLIHRLEDIEGRIEAELERYHKLEPALQAFIQNTFTRLYRFQFDGEQSLDDLHAAFKEMLERLVLIPCLARVKFLASPVEAGVSPFAGLGAEDILAKLLTVEEEDEAFTKPRRRLSLFNRFCPVSYYETGNAVAGNHDYSVLFKHFVFYLAGPEQLEKFTQYPLRYLREEPAVKRTRVLVMGAPLSGKTGQAKFLARQRGLAYFGPDLITSDPLLLEKSAVEGVVSNADIINRLFDLLAQVDKDSSVNGWVIDGLIDNKDSLKQLLEKSFTPELIINLKHDNLDDLKARYRGRFQVNNDVKESLEVLQKPWEDPFHPSFRSTLIPAIPNGDSLSLIEDESFLKWNEDYEKSYAELVKIVQTTSIPVQTFSSTALAAKIHFDIMTKLDPFYPQAGNFSNPNLQFGFSKEFCPVILRQRQVLKRADASIAVLYKNKIYVFSSKDKMELFMESPDFYTNYGKDAMIEEFANVGAKIETRTHSINALPPRIFSVGPLRCGKSAVVDYLGSKYKLKVLNYKSVIVEWATKYDRNLSEMVEKYLKDADANPLPDNIFQLALDHIFYDYASKEGFILEGFPRSRREAETMEQFGYYPDAMLYHVMESALYVKRNIASKLQEISTRTIINDDGQKVPAKIDNAEDVGTRELNESYEKETEKIEEIVELVKTAMKVSVVRLDSSRCLRVNQDRARRGLEPFLEHRNSLFLHVVPISRKKAHELLSTGFAKYSKFGKYCPVEINKNSAYFQTSHSEKPVIAGDKVYFLSNKKAIRSFLQNAQHYIDYHNPCVKTTTGIIISGPPKAGKTELANRLCNTFGLQYLTLSEVIKAVLERSGKSPLKEEIINILSQGLTLSVDLCVQALKSVLQSVSAFTKGWILDGFPLTAQEIEIMEHHQILPNLALILEIQASSQHERMQADQKSFRSQLLSDCLAASDAYQKLNFQTEDDVAFWHALYCGEAPKFKEAYGTRRFITFTRSGELSKWNLCHQVTELCRTSFTLDQEFQVKESLDKPFAIEGVGLDRDYVEANFGKFKTYCPVSFVDDDELYNVLEYTPKSIIHYKGLFYKVCDVPGFLDRFIANPERYAENASKQLPNVLPSPLSLSSFGDLKFPMQLALQGYCPVSFAHGNHTYESLVRGVPKHCAVFGSSSDPAKGDQAVYSMCQPACHDRFMRQPWKYVNQKLPKKLPPPPVTIDIRGLPVMGYLEQSVATFLQKALVTVGAVRPKVSERSVSGSAIEYLALYLKANNPKLKEYVRSNYQKRLDNLVKDCESLKLITSSFTVGGYVPFKALNDEIKSAFSQVYHFNGEVEIISTKAQVVPKAASSSKPASVRSSHASLPPIEKGSKSSIQQQQQQVQEQELLNA